MNWIEEVIVDIIVTLFVLVALLVSAPWMWWVIAIYTLLLLVAKSIVLTGDGFLARSQKKQTAPEWFIHLLYAANIMLLGIAGWWYLLGGWCLIWLFSYLGQRRVAAG